MFGRFNYTGWETANFHYQTQSGDWLSKIAERYYGDAMLWPEIYNMNASVVGPDPDKLLVGIELKMPKHLNKKLMTIDDLYEKISNAPRIVEKMLKKDGKLDTNKVLMAGGAGLLALALLFPKKKR